MMQEKQNITSEDIKEIQTKAVERCIKGKGTILNCLVFATLQKYIEKIIVPKVIRIIELDNYVQKRIKYLNG